MKKGIFKQGICEICKKSYHKYKKKMRFCSTRCVANFKRNKLYIGYDDVTKKRIIQYSTIDDKTDCWNWNKYIGKDGRGKCWYKGKNELAYRTSYIVFKKEIPENMLVCHKCDNPSCVNPDHLFLGTDKDNSDDCTKKNRRNRGEKIKISRLKEPLILEIRDLYKNGYSQQKIADIYGVVQTTISSIVLRKTWTHI